MPASVYEPIGSALKKSLLGPRNAGTSGLDSKMASSFQKSLLTPVVYDDAERQSSNLSEKQKQKYIILTRTENRDVTEKPVSSSPVKLDQVPEPRLTLFRRDQVEIGYRTSQGGPGSGMFNMGNTCYLNSTLQALFHTPALVNYLRYGGHENTCSSSGFNSCTICIMSATLRGTNGHSPMKPIKIYEKLKLICKHLVHGRQEDAHEFLRYLIESLQKSYLISRKVPKTVDNQTKETTPFNQIFGGYMRQDVVCLKCKHVSTTFQHFMDLLLDIRQADNIDAALGGYFRRENLGQGETMYKCEKCLQKVPATKQYKIERPPLVLCIQLKRFNMMGGKNGRPVLLSRKLNITNHVRWAQSKNVTVEYKLVSMINHVGPSPNCGHYTSIAEAPNGMFYRFDDASVSPTSVQNALNTSAYVIFYEMVKSSRNQVVSPNPVKTKVDMSPKTPKVPEKKIIGPQLPPSSNGNVAKVAPSPKAIPASPGIVKQPVKPKVITDQSPVSKKASSQARLTCSLVPYDGDSESDGEEKVKKQDSPVSTAVTTSKPSPVTNTKPSPVINSKPLPVVTKPSPFLPRALNLKKLKETVQKEDSLVLPNPVPTVNGGGAKVPTPSKPSPNRDSDAEAIFSAKEDSTITKNSAARNEFHVRDCESHSPSVHSDNSSGSTTSFTVTDIGSNSGPRNGNSGETSFATSRQKWTVVSTSSEPSESNKRPSVVPASQESEDCLSSKKRKKANMFDSGTGTILGKAAELGKDFLSAGAKLFKTSKTSKDDGDSTAMESSSMTSCEATTSYQNEKASSSKVDSTQDSEDSGSRKKQKKKKKKKKKHREDSDSESWEEKTKENLSKFEKPSEDDTSCKKSTSDPNAPIKNWDSKPGAGTTERSVTWDGRKSTNIVDELSRASEIRSWGGDRSSLEKKNPEQRKRSLAQEMDAEIDAGRVKKFKKQNHDEPSRWANSNPFQIAQEHRNKGEDFTEKRQFRRHSDSFSRYDKPRHSESQHGGRFSDQFNRNSSGRFSDHRPPHHREHHFSHKYRGDQHSKYNGNKKFRR